LRTTIVAAGRVVIPKALRDRLGLVGGQLLDIQERDGLLTAVPDHPVPVLDARTVRDTLENVRR
jgi:AbrB family looped-hinge helix DNA binding protein